MGQFLFWVILIQLSASNMPKKTSAIKVTDIRGEKPWLKKVGISKYAVETVTKNKTFLIVCEGQSEELYFKSFPVISARVNPVPLGCSKSTLVECAKAIVEDESYDEVWCVFDMDYKPDVNGQFTDFDNAIKSAIAAGFKCAYSNDAFELWYVLHYQLIEQEQLRTFYFQKLSEFWNFNYEKEGKNKKIARSLYSLLENDPKASQERAIKNAEKLFEAQKDKLFHLQNPVTKIYKLVESLNIHLRH